MSIPIDKTTALILVDLQNDFLPGGALAVPNGDQIIPVLNDYITCFSSKGGHIIVTRDWHPVKHISFKERGGPWPPHCVQNTRGADLSSQLKLPYGIEVISKGILNDKDAYSGFEGTDLKRRLDHKGVDHVFVGGLATDYCVKNTVLDAIRDGFETYLLLDAIRAVNVQPDDSDLATQAMIQAGAQKITLDQVK